MERKHADISRNTNVIPFTRPSKAAAKSSLGNDRDKAILDHYRRRLEFERKAKSGLLTDAEEIQGDMELRVEVFAIARKFNL